MIKQRILVPGLITLGLALGACGGGGGGGGGGDTASFDDQLRDTCRAITSDLDDIEAPGAIGDFQTSADDASSAYEEGLVALKKLEAPAKQRADFEDLQSNIDEEIGLFDQISAAAAAGDEKTVSRKISSLGDLDEANAALAGSLQVRSCAFQPVFTDGPGTPPTEPPGTEPSDTEPTETSPVTDPDTVAPATTPPTRAPTTTATTTTTAPVGTATTTAVGTGGNKTIVTRADQITPQGDYTFVDTPPGTVSLLQTAMDLDPLVRPQPGQVFAVDVVVDEIAITRVFAFDPDAGTLTPGSAESLQTTLAGSAAITPTSMAGVSGGSFTTGGNLFFVAEDGGVLFIIVGKDQTSLEAGFSAFVDSVVN